ncbi:MAG: aminotransferase [Pseudomonadota bacterium]
MTVAAPFAPHLVHALDPPIMEARSWLNGKVFPAERPLINLSQAAPADPPPEALREAMARAVRDDPSAHLYGPVLGDPALREEIAAQWSAAYGGEVRPADVAVTAGCNQAFCAALATLAGPGDAVLLPYPWYFNHKMWLDMAGVETRPLPCGPGMLPDLEAAEALMADGRARAIVLVTPNNPTGAEYPSGLVEAFFELAERHGAALVLDETYRDFDGREGAPHGLFQRPGWRDRLIQLYSFSKAYRLTGHRCGAMVASPERIALAEKWLDTVTICAPRLGQIAALHGLRELSGFVAEQRAEILARRAVIEDEARQALLDWEVLGAGAYFAYLRHPFEAPSPVVAKALVDEQSLLLLPGTIFCPKDDPLGERTLRMAFANEGPSGLREALSRMAAFGAGRAAA